MPELMLSSNAQRILYFAAFPDNAESIMPTQKRPNAHPLFPVRCTRYSTMYAVVRTVRSHSTEIEKKKQSTMIRFLHRRHRPYYHQDDEWYLLPQLLDPRVDDLERRTDRDTDDIRRLRRDHEDAHEDARMFRSEFEADQRAETHRRRDRDDADAEVDQAYVRADG